MAETGCRGCLSKKVFDRKRAKDFKKEPIEFLRAYCDKLNIWEEGALLIRDRLSEMKQDGRLNKELKAILERVERELLKRHWANIPKHPGYHKDLERLIDSLKKSYPHLK